MASRSSALRLVLVVVVQAAILAAIPLRQVRARMDGTEVTLRTVPVDPYDVLSGYYVTLAYEVERPTAAVVEPGSGPGWLVVAPDGEAWRWVECCAAARPQHLPDGAVALRVERTGASASRRRDGSVCSIPSAGRFYLPESRRAEVEAAMRATGGRALVDLKVDGEGNVALLRLRVGELVIEE
jgi:uncharacterized membrane-anchored protein